jgi:hypothetical protein
MTEDPLRPRILFVRDAVLGDLTRFFSTCLDMSQPASINANCEHTKQPSACRISQHYGSHNRKLLMKRSVAVGIDVAASVRGEGAASTL